MLEFYNRVDALRKERKLTFAELSDGTGIPTSTINDWRKKSPGSENILIIANYFDASVDYLLGRIDYRYSHKSNLLPNSLRVMHEAEKLKLDDNVTDIIIKMMAFFSE